MKIHQTALSEVLIFEPHRFGDGRGYFSEVWNQAVFDQAVGSAVRFVQDNESLSAQEGTLRGLHYQAPPHAQGKLVRCVQGEIYDVAVDFRTGSDTFGHWVGERISAENGRQLWIPEGFLHGFLTLTPNTLVAYKCTAFYDKVSDGSVAWDSFGISWPETSERILSDKDRDALRAEDMRSPFQYMEKIR